MHSQLTKIRLMNYQDIPFAVRLTDNEKWNFSPEDFKVMIKHWPECNFVAENSKGRKVGIGSVLIHGKLAWLSNFIVDKKERGKGYGKALVEHSIRITNKKGVNFISLYTYDDRVDFYSQFGFMGNGFYTAYTGKINDKCKITNCYLVDKKTMIEIKNWDQDVSGLDRSEFLDLFYSYFKKRFYVKRNKGKIIGYIAAGSNPDGSYEIPQWVAKDKDTARTLIIGLAQKLYYKRFLLLIPWVNPNAIELMKEFKFKPGRNYIYMALGTNIEKRKVEFAYALGGLDIW